MGPRRSFATHKFRLRVLLFVEAERCMRWGLVDVLRERISTLVQSASKLMMSRHSIACRKRCKPVACEKVGSTTQANRIFGRMLLSFDGSPMKCQGIIIAELTSTPPLPTVGWLKVNPPPASQLSLFPAPAISSLKLALCARWSPVDRLYFYTSREPLWQDRNSGFQVFKAAFRYWEGLEL